MDENKQLSIIIPVYNVEKYIRSCLISIFNQGLDCEQFEVIIVDDGTTDESLEVIKDMIDSHSNICVIEQTNQGMSIARNNGMRRAKGKYVMFVDSDDLLVEKSLPSLLEKTLESSVDMSIARFESMGDDEILNFDNKVLDDFYFRIVPANDYYSQEFNPRDCFVWHTLYKREFLENENIKFVERLYFEDIVYTTECFLKAKNCMVSNKFVYIYRRHLSSTISNIDIQKLFCINEVIKRVIELRNSRVLLRDQKRKVNKTIFVTFSLLICYMYRDKLLFNKRNLVIKDLKNKVPFMWFCRGIKEIIVSLLYNIKPDLYIVFRRFIYVNKKKITSFKF